MSKLLTKGNIAVFEYPKGANKPKFTLEPDGVLWVEGYDTPLFPHAPRIRAMKRFELNLKNYTVIGNYNDAVSRIDGDFSDLLFGLNTDRCVVMMKTSTIEKP